MSVRTITDIFISPQTIGLEMLDLEVASHLDSVWNGAAIVDKPDGVKTLFKNKNYSIPADSLVGAFRSVARKVVETLNMTQYIADANAKIEYGVPSFDPNRVTLKQTDPTQKDVGQVIRSVFVDIGVLEDIRGKLIQAQHRGRHLEAVLKSFCTQAKNLITNQRVRLYQVSNKAGERNDLFLQACSDILSLQDEVTATIKGLQTSCDSASKRMEYLLRAESSLRMYLNFLESGAYVNQAQSKQFHGASVARETFGDGAVSL